MLTYIPKALAFDLDGTLAESKQPLTTAMGVLIGNLLEHIPVAIMSGAAFLQFEKQFFPSLSAQSKLENLYIFPCNAAQSFVYQEGAWTPRYDYSLTDSEKELIYTELRATLYEVGFPSEPAPWGLRIEDRIAQISYSPLGQQAPILEKETWKKTHDNTRRLAARALSKRLPDFSVEVGGVTTIDITRQGINKAYGIEKLSEMTGISIPDMLYVGDALEEGGNDSVVIPTGVQTRAVANPNETATLINEILTVL